MFTQRSLSIRHFAIPAGLAIGLVVWAGCSGGSNFQVNPGGGTTAGTTTAGTTTAGTTTAGTTTAGTTTAGTTTAGTTTAGTTTAGTTTAGTTGGACTSGFSPSYIGLFTPRTFNHMPVKVFFNGDLTVSSTVAGQGSMDYQALALAGFQEWTTAVGNTLSFTQVNTAAQADIVVNFATINNPSSPVAWSEQFTFTGNTITGATVTLSAQQSGAAITPGLLQLMGAGILRRRTLGLGQSNNPNDIESANPTVTQPSQTDINTLKTLYCTYF